MMINIIATSGVRRSAATVWEWVVSRRRNLPTNNIDSVEIEIIFRRLRFEDSKSKEKTLKIYLFLPRRRFSQSSSPIPTEKGKLKDCVTHSADSFNVFALMKLNFQWECGWNGFSWLYSVNACQNVVKQLFMNAKFKIYVQV